MHKSALILLSALVLPASAEAKTPPPAPATSVPTYVTTAIADPARAADKVDDARRQMAAVMAFTGVKPGQSVLEIAPGSGYWTRVFSAIVGPSGHVYQVWPKEMARFSAKDMTAWQALAKTPHYANVTVLEQPAAMLSVPKPVDLVFTVQNYHDYHDAFMGPVDMAVFDRQVFAALKPGGSFVVIDHSAPAGSGAADTNTLHRIDPALVKQEVEAAGFVLAASSDALRNPADPLDIKVFDKAIRGHTDQFILRFKKGDGGN